MTLHCIHTDTQRNPNTCTQSVLYTRQSHTPPYPLLKLPRLRYESMYQSSESRWDRNPLIDLWLQSKCTEAGLPRLRKNTERRHNGGTTVEGKAEEITSQALRVCSAGGVGGCWWCSERSTWGRIHRANTDWQRPVGGLAVMSGASDLPSAFHRLMVRPIFFFFSRCKDTDFSGSGRLID